MKYRTDISNTICWGDLGTFVGSLFKHFDKGLFATNQLYVCDELLDKEIGILTNKQLMNLFDYRFQQALRYISNDTEAIIFFPRSPLPLRLLG